jgi:hypothetical protein
LAKEPKQGGFLPHPEKGGENPGFSLQEIIPAKRLKKQPLASIIETPRKLWITK